MHFPVKSIHAGSRVYVAFARHLVSMFSLRAHRRNMAMPRGEYIITRCASREFGIARHFAMYKYFLRYL